MKWAGIVIMIALLLLVVSPAYANQGEITSRGKQIVLSEIKRLKNLPDHLAKRKDALVQRLLKRYSGPIIGIGLRYEESDDRRRWVARLAKNKPAERAGIKIGDEILSLNGKVNLSPEDFLKELTEDERVGRVLTFEILRNGERHAHNGEKHTIVVTTEVLRPDKTAEVEALAQVIEAEAIPFLNTVNERLTVVISLLESGQLTVEELNEGSRAKSAQEAFLAFIGWLGDKREATEELLNLEWRP